MYPLSSGYRYRKKVFSYPVLFHCMPAKRIGNKMYTHFHQMMDLFFFGLRNLLLPVRMIMSKFVASPPPPPLRKARGSNDTFNNIN